MEGAELVCDRSDVLAHGAPPDIAGAAIELSRAAGHDSATLRHALGIGRARLRRRPHDHVATRGARLLEDVISFLGVKPRGSDARVARPRTVATGGDEDRPC